MSIRVLLADDHPIVRDGLRFSLERSGRDIEVVGEAADGIAVLKLAETLPVDVFILDITMPRMNGLVATRELLKRRPSALVIILSLHDSRAMVESALAAGARGFLTKETAGARIAEAVAEVKAGRFYLSPEILHYAVEKVLTGPSASAPVKSSVSDLTARETRVMQLVAEGRTSREIAAEFTCSIETVRAHRKNLMAKLGVHKQADLVRLAIKEGLCRP